MKTSRTLLLGILLAGSAQASTWSDLWYRPDQQGQHALQAGDTKRAAELFTDPRHQAYAELQSGQYAAAAKRLAPFADPESQYNRGNALAKNGDLQGALSAYDGALKHTDLEAALRRDAEHNRDLVARQLQAQKDQAHASSGQQPPQKGKEDGKSQGSQSQQGSGDSGSQGSPTTAGSASASPSQGKDNKADAGKQGGSPSTTPTSPAQAKSGEAKSGTEKNGADKSGADKNGDEQRQANGTSPSTQDRNAQSPQSGQQQATAQQQGAAGQQAAAEQQQALAQQQAAAQQAKGEPQKPLPGSGAQGGAEQQDARQAALGDSLPRQSEQQLALEQWLRQIPDDPGGLLRRKFLIEHLMKQQQEQP